MSDIDNHSHYKIETATRHLCTPDWIWDCKDASIIQGYIIWLVEGGETRLTSRFGSHTVHRGDFLLMPATSRDFYRGRQTPGRPLDVTWLHLLPARPKETGISQQRLKPLRFLQKLEDPTFAIKLSRRLLAAPKHEKTIWLESLLMEGARVSESTAEKTPAEAMVDTLCRKISENPSRFRRLDDLPQNYACSRDHLIRLFKKYRGITPGEYMIRTRIDHAKQLLRLPGMSVKQVAMNLGYPDPYTFSKQFKIRVGVPPAQFASP